MKNVGGPLIFISISEHVCSFLYNTAKALCSGDYVPEMTAKLFKLTTWKGKKLTTTELVLFDESSLNRL